ncbi:MAG: NAD(P)/FAD-dependent oxidoreductase [Prevotellaceae bacterium]|jgi:all-trans-retinol 13,14-reductase|nr:NAD(P)/FAD-dependent oxidoreductase [Prevotellaceae bacterium]
MEHNQSIAIIGGGVGGLFCGAILSKEGYRVSIFEQHYKIGGGLHQFRRDGVTFETGMHVVGAFQQGGALRRICSYLGIMDQLEILPEDDSCYELFHIGCDQKKYPMPKGAKRFAEALCAEFPEEKENIARYMQELYKICDEVKLYSLENTEVVEASTMPFMGNSENFLKSVGGFINSFTKNERLRAVLAFGNPLYAGEQHKTPAYIHAFISKFCIEGASRFVGGSQQLADALSRVITDAGGIVAAANGVRRIEIEGKSIDHIVTADGAKRRADWYISSIHPSSLFRLLDASKLQRSYRERIDSIPNTYSAFMLYLVFKPGTFPFFNYTYYYQDDYSMTWEHDVYTADTWPKGLMCATPPATAHDVFAEKMIVSCIMNFETVRQWEHTTTGKRGAAYLAFKQRCEQQALCKLEQIFPHIRTCIKSTYCATPLTIRDYYNQKEGAMYGVKNDCNNMALSHISVRTKLKNLLLTGQNINLHGILGVPLTAIHTCAELVGMEYLLNKINKYKDI